MGLIDIIDREIAYFSMEIGLENDISLYSGGLAVLAGDHLKSCADLGVPVVAVSLMYHEGYFNQVIDGYGRQRESYPRWDPSSKLKLMPQEAHVNIQGRDVKVRAWEYVYKGVSGKTVPMYFLDSDVEGNSSADRGITSRLYGGDSYLRLAQETLLGIGGVRFLRALGCNSLSTYHINEGHGAFVTLELLKENGWVDDRVRQMCVFTTHTPVGAGHDVFNYGLALDVLRDMMPWHMSKLAGHGALNMTKLALSLSRYHNGVSMKHGEVSRMMFPESNMDYITNGVHSTTWTCDSFKELYDKYLPGWRENPCVLQEATHDVAKRRLIGYVNDSCGRDFDPELLTIGFARRAATYKRANFIFSDIDRLVSIAQGKVQFVFSGKAHPRDEQGKDLIQSVVHYANNLKGKVGVVFLEGYDMELGAMLTSGVDLWLNNPHRPHEASGTSGMKAVHNGVPNFSTLDGWWIEGHKEGVTGWSIGPKPENGYDNVRFDVELKDLYSKLEDVIVPMYYNHRHKWAEVMRNAIALNASVFNTHRMVQEYLDKAYRKK